MCSCFFFAQPINLKKQINGLVWPGHYGVYKSWGTDIYSIVHTESDVPGACTGVGVRAYYWGGPNGRDSHRVSQFDTRGKLSINIDAPGRVYKMKIYLRTGGSNWSAKTIYPA